jgi:diguanylate cyclase (GGDEF)-like protein
MMQTLRTPLPSRPNGTAPARPLLVAVAIAAVVLVAGLAAAYLEAISAWSRENDDIAAMASLEDDPKTLADGAQTMQLSRFVTAKTQIVKHGVEDGEAGCIDRLVDRLGVLMGSGTTPSPAIQTVCKDRKTAGHIVDESPRLVVLRPRFDAEGRHIATEVTLVETAPRPGLFDAALAPSVIIAILAVTLIAGFAAFQFVSRSQRRYAALWEAAAVDGLTGCLRREAFLAALSGAVAEARASGGRLSLLVVDVDDLKAVKDRHGHAGGDAAIRMVAEELARGLRSNDIVGRLGGDEFAALMAGAPLADAVAAAERVRAGVAAANGAGADAAVTATVSIGVAELANGESATALMARADAALYAAKHGDRNRVQPSAT